MGLNKEDILFKTDRGLKVFGYFFKSNWPGINKPFRNPFYDDKKAACHIYFDKPNNQYRFIDFGDSSYNCDCFGFVGLVFNLQCSVSEQFVQIMEIIDRELVLGLASNHDKIREITNKFPEVKVAAEIDSLTIADLRNNVSKKFVPPLFKEFSQTEINFWGMFGIDMQTLRNYNVVSLQRFYGINKDGKEYQIETAIDEPMFGYLGKRFLKVYRPRSTNRFYYAGDLHEGYCFGLKQLPLRGDILFITGGEKDVLSLSARGFNAICFNSETVTIPKNLVRRLSFRFKHIVLMYDRDETGCKAMEKQVNQLREFDVKMLLLPLKGTPQQKDISDFFKMGHSAQDLMKLFRDLLDVLYEETMSLLRSFEVDFDKPPAVPEAVIAINEVPIGSAGNLMAITGPEGSGKSNYLGAVLAGTMVPEGIGVDTLGTEIARNTAGKAVLYYDTEQSEEQLFKNLRQIVKRSGATRPPSWFKTYGLVGMGRKDRLVSILHSMDRFYYEHGGIHLVVIDGIADLIDGVNDEEKSVALIDELFRLAGIYKTCILCVLHLSPSGYKLRGHLGSEIQRKAAGILCIEKEEDKTQSLVKALKVRDGSPLDVPQILMAWDDTQKFHVFVGEKDKTRPQERKIEELSDIARHIFEREPSLNYMKIIYELQERLQVKERQAKNYLKFMRDNHIIEALPGENNVYKLKIPPF